MDDFDEFVLCWNWDDWLLAVDAAVFDDDAVGFLAIVHYLVLSENEEIDSHSVFSIHIQYSVYNNM